MRKGIPGESGIGDGMKIVIESTDRVVDVNGVPARVWEGKTESGIEVICCITRIAAPKSENLSQFERELKETRPVSDRATTIFPLRMVL